MKTQEEIDELYHKCWDDFISKHDDTFHYYSFVEGYTQCQKDMAEKKYTEEDLREAINVGISAQQVLIQIAEECFRKYPNNKELYTTDELIDAYKAGVIDGFKEAQNYNSPTKKQD